MGDNNEDLSLKDLFGRSKEIGDGKSQEHIINHIFTSCAGENNIVVETNKLILFITPFLHDNNTAVNQLRKTLDPNNLNQEIDLDQFHILMETWISKISVEEDFPNITPRSDFRRLDDGDLPYNKEKAKPKDLNKTILEEQIQELEYQKKKMSEEMERMKIELTNSLETNENLQDRLEKSLKKVNEEQKLNERLQELIKNKDDENEIELENLKKHSVGLEKKVQSLEMKIEDFNEELIEIQNENSKLEKRNQRLLKEKDAVVEELIGLQTEIDAWKQDFASQQELYANLNEEKKNLEDVIEEYTCEIEKLKFEKTTLENLLKPITKKSTESNSNFSSSFTRSNSFNRTVDKSSNKNRSSDDFSRDSDSGDDLPVRLHYMAAVSNTNESLQEEISKATSEGCSFVSDQSSEEKYVENEEKSLQIEETSLEIEEKSLETEEKSDSIKPEMTELKVTELNSNVADLKTRLSLSEDKESILLERNRALEENLEEKRRHLLEITGKLNDYHKLELKCKELTSKINNLEHENSLKHIKIVDLTLEMDQLRKNKKLSSSSRGIKIESQQQEDDLNKIINQLKIEKREIENEKYRLEDVLRSLEEERVSLKIEIQTHLTKIMKLEENERDLKHQMTILRYEMDNLTMKASTIQVKLESIESEKELLKNENDDLRRDNERLQHEALSAKSSNSTLEKEQRDLNELTLKLKLEKVEKEKWLINENWRRETDQLKKKLAQKEQELETYEIQFDQSQKEIEMFDQEKCEMEEELCALEKKVEECSCFEEKYHKVLDEIKILKKDNEVLNEEIKKLREEINDYESFKKNQNEKLQEILNSKKDVENEVEKLKENLEEIGLNLKKVKSESKMIKNEKNHLQHENERIQEKFENLQKNHRDLSEKFEKNKKEYDVLKIEHEIFEENSKKLSRENSKTLVVCQEKLTQSHQDIDQILKEKLELKSKIESMDVELTQLKEKLLQCHKEKHSFDEIKYNLERENNNLKKHFEENELKLKEIEVINIDLLEQLEKNKITITSYKQIKDKLSKTNEDLEKLVENKDNLINEMKEEIILIKQNNELFKKEEDKLKENIKEFEDELKRKESKISCVKNELVSLKESKENINQELFVYKGMFDSYEQKIEAMEILIGNLEKNLEEKDFILKERELKLENLQNEIDEKLNNLKELTEKFEQLKQLKQHKNEDDLKNKIDDLQKDVEKKNNILKTFIKENKNLKTLLNNPEVILGKLEKLSEENEHLKELNKKSSNEDKAKMIEEINKSFSEAMQKVYFTEKIMYETEEDFTTYCKKEIEKYKKENETLKKSYENEIANLLKEMETTKNEMETTKSELEMVLAEKETISAPNLRETKKKPFECRSESKINSKRSNYDKLTFKNEKLEQKVLDLEDQLTIEKKVLSESISTRQLIEDELKNLNEENHKLEQQLKNVNIEEIMGEIDKYKEEFKKLELKIQEDEDFKTTTLNQLDEIKENLSQKRMKLKNNTLTIASCFSIPTDLIKKKIFINDLNISKIPDNFLMFEQEMLKVKEQMEISSNVLNYLCLKKSKVNESTQTENVEVKNTNEVPRTKSLKPATFVPKCFDPLESLQFASSGDAGRSRDLGVVFSRPQENEDYYGLQNDSLEEHVLPTLNEEILQNINLSFQDIPDNDLEEMYQKISSAYDLDQLSITTRLQKQEEKTANKKRKLLEELTSLLDEFRNVEGLESVTGRLDLTGKSCEDLVVSAELLGFLRKEKMMMGCLGLMIAYLKRSRRALRDAQNQFRSIESQWINDEKLQIQTVTFNPSVPHLNLRSNRIQHLPLERSRVTETHISPRPLSRAIKMVTYSLISWMVFMGICCLTVAFFLDDDYTYLPWGFNSFDHPWMPFVKKQYLRGPPPT